MCLAKKQPLHSTPLGQYTSWMLLQKTSVIQTFIENQSLGAVHTLKRTHRQSWRSARLGYAGDLSLSKDRQVDEVQGLGMQGTFHYQKAKKLCGGCTASGSRCSLRDITVSSASWTFNTRLLLTNNSGIHSYKLYPKKALARAATARGIFFLRKKRSGSKWQLVLHLVARLSDRAS